MILSGGKLGSQQFNISENKMEMKLSEMFDYADKNLRHAVIIYGMPKYNLCCAVGTVAYILSDGKTTNPRKLKKIDMRLWQRYKELTKEFSKRNHQINLVILNDWLFFSFKMLANKCRKLGL